MYIVHVVMAASAAMLALIALVAVKGRTDQRLVTLVACVALVVGHLASLLPAAPQWYAALVVLGSVAGFGWVVWTIANALSESRQAQSAQRTVAQAPARPALRVVQATVVDSDARPASKVVSIVRDEPVRRVTRQQILAAGPEGAERATGPTYVAANLVDYVAATSGTKSARTHRRTAARNATPVRTASPEQRLRSLQVRAAYAQSGSRAVAHDLRA
ncbi:MAG: hypothetical protein Q4G51_08125 [Dermatophilus congolensis]|nr:hypothetical protein [Dermatophilus congolensis]